MEASSYRPLNAADVKTLLLEEARLSKQ